MITDLDPVRRPRVYISGPLSTGGGNREQNVAFAANAFRALIEAGYAPLCPHLTHYAEAKHDCHFDHATWLSIDEEWVRVADAVYRIVGPSKGAKQECDLAHSLGIPVFSSLSALNDWRATRWRSDAVSTRLEPASAVADVRCGDVEFASGAVRSGDTAGACFHLVSPVGLRRVAEACHEGAKKYSPYNWEKGMPLVDLLEHALQHIYHYLDGDRTDDHLGHAAWNLLAACHSEERWPELNEGTLRPVRAGACARNPNETLCTET